MEEQPVGELKDGRTVSGGTKALKKQQVGSLKHWRTASGHSKLVLAASHMLPIISFCSVWNRRHMWPFQEELPNLQLTYSQNSKFWCSLVYDLLFPHNMLYHIWKGNPRLRCLLRFNTILYMIKLLNGIWTLKIGPLLSELIM